MLCQKCFGQKVVTLESSINGHVVKRIMPCPECEGQGSTYCCEGESAQPGECDE